MEPTDLEEIFHAFVLSSAVWLGTFAFFWAVFP